MEYEYRLAQNNQLDTVFSIVLAIVLLLILVYVVCTWRIYNKAGEPGWAAIIPIYSTFVFVKIINKPTWWVIPLSVTWINNYVPQALSNVLNILFLVFYAWGWNLMAKKFGKSEGFTVGIVLLPIIFLPILAFGNAQYKNEDEIDINEFGTKTQDVNTES